MFGAPPASTVLGLPGVLGGLRGSASAILRCTSEANLPKDPQTPSHLRKYAGPQHLCHHRGVLRVGARNRAGSFDSGDGTFSSGAALALPNFRASFVLRDARHSKTKTASVRDFSKCQVAQRGWGFVARCGAVLGRDCAVSAGNRPVQSNWQCASPGGS